MGKGFKHGSSGGKSIDLNFTVQAYPSEVELNVATPPENTIGVVTTNPIKGWYFAVTQPEKPTEGEVWFNVGASSQSPFNALKGNTIMVYPMSAKQYVSGAWTNVTAKIYQNSAWVKWERYIFENGTIREGGTWKPTISDGYITQSIDLPQQARKIFTHDEPVNVSGCTKATFVIKSSSPVYTYTEVGIYSQSGYAANLTPIAFANSDSYAPDTDTELSFTIPSGVTQCYFGFGVNRVNTGSATTTLSVKSIKVE